MLQFVRSAVHGLRASRPGPRRAVVRRITLNFILGLAAIAILGPRGACATGNEPPLGPPELTWYGFSPAQRQILEAAVGGAERHAREMADVGIRYSGSFYRREYPRPELEGGELDYEVDFTVWQYGKNKRCDDKTVKCTPVGFVRKVETRHAVTPMLSIYVGENTAGIYPPPSGKRSKRPIGMPLALLQASRIQNSPTLRDYVSYMEKVLRIRDDRNLDRDNVLLSVESRRDGTRRFIVLEFGFYADRDRKGAREIETLKIAADRGFSVEEYRHVRARGEDILSETNVKRQYAAHTHQGKTYWVPQSVEHRGINRHGDSGRGEVHVDSGLKVDSVTLGGDAADPAIFTLKAMGAKELRIWDGFRESPRRADLIRPDTRPAQEATDAPPSRSDPTGRIVFKSSWQNAATLVPLKVCLASWENPRHRETFFAHGNSQSVTVPVGKYRLSYATMQVVSPSSEPSAILLVQKLDEPVEIAAGAQYTVSLRDSPGVRPLVSNDCMPDKLRVDFAYTGVDDAVVELVSPYGPNEQADPTFRVRVYRGDKPEGESASLASGEYG